MTADSDMQILIVMTYCFPVLAPIQSSPGKVFEMLQSMTIDGLKTSPFTLASITHRSPQLTRSGSQFIGVIAGECVLRFAPDGELAFHWRAAGGGSTSLANYNITQQPDRYPVFIGPKLLCVEGEPLAWGEQHYSLVELLDGLEWQPLVREALLAVYPFECEP